MLYPKLYPYIQFFLDPYFYWGTALLLGILLEMIRQSQKSKETGED